MKHFTTPGFWKLYNALPSDVRLLADKNYALLQRDPSHPSVKLKPIGVMFSVRVGIHYRALARVKDENYLWLWIGTHAEYDRLIS